MCFVFGIPANNYTFKVKHGIRAMNLFRINNEGITAMSVEVILRVFIDKFEHV